MLKLTKIIHCGIVAAQDLFNVLSNISPSAMKIAADSYLLEK